MKGIFNGEEIACPPPRPDLRDSDDGRRAKAPFAKGVWGGCELAQSDAGLEGLVAFLEKRPPVWKEG